MTGDSSQEPGARSQEREETGDRRQETASRSGETRFRCSTPIRPYADTFLPKASHRGRGGHRLPPETEARWLLATGYWLLATGYSATGYWMRLSCQFVSIGGALEFCPRCLRRLLIHRTGESICRLRELTSRKIRQNEDRWN